MKLSESLLRFRLEQHLTQKQLAKSISVHERTIQRYEAGEVIPSVTVLIKIANTFDVSLDYISGCSNNPVRNR